MSEVSRNDSKPQPTAKPQRAPRPQPPVDVAPRIAQVGPPGYLAVGRLVGAHGMRGEVKVESFTDFLARFEPGSVLLLGDELEEVTVLSSRPHKSNILLQLSALSQRDDAELLRGQWLYVHEDDATPLDENSYWVHDLLGMAVVTDEGTALGTVYDILFTGANEVYVVRAPDTPRELLLPATDEVVVGVDVVARRMTVHLIPGLLD